MKRSMMSSVNVDPLKFKCRNLIMKARVKRQHNSSIADGSGGQGHFMPKPSDEDISSPQVLRGLEFNTLQLSDMADRQVMSAEGGTRRKT